MNRQWKKFDELTERCYTDMIHNTTDMNNWNSCFKLLTEIISDGRAQDPDFAKSFIFWTTGPIMCMTCRDGWKIISVSWICVRCMQSLGLSAVSCWRCLHGKKNILRISVFCWRLL